MRSVFFDLDGTLVDPIDAIGGSVCYALGMMGRPIPAMSSLGWLIGPPLQGSLAQLLGSDDSDEAARCLAFYRDRFSTTGLLENRVYDGVREMLGSLRSGGFRLWVVTSKPTVYAVPILEHGGLFEFFEGVYGCELDGMRANKGELIDHVLRCEGLLASECVMVGDREHDLLGSASHGVPGVGALWGYGSAEELRTAGAVALCESPADVVAFLKD